MKSSGVKLVDGLIDFDLALRVAPERPQVHWTL